MSKTNKYEITELQGDILDNLPDKDLEELVISYIQLSESYYLLSNSLANRSTTIKIECEFIKRDKNALKRAVVQVKSGKSSVLDALDYRMYDDDGYTVYLYAPCVTNTDQLNNCIVIQREELKRFYDDYKTILPENITFWEKL